MTQERSPVQASTSFRVVLPRLALAWILLEFLIPRGMVALDLNNLAPVRDLYVAENTPSSNYGGLRTGLLGDPAGRMGLILQYDLASIPPHSTVVTATLSFQKAFTDHSGTMSMQLRKHRSAWAEASLSWNGAQPMSDPLFGTLSLNTGLAFPFMTDGPLKTMVQEWIDDPSANHGVTILPAVFSGTYVSFHMKEDMPSWMPIRLSVTYQLPAPEQLFFGSLAQTFELQSGASLRQQYDAGFKHLVDLSGSLGVVGTLTAHLILDLDDLLGYTPEGRAGWISTWIDVSTEFGITLQPLPAGIDLLAIERKPPIDDPSRDLSFEVLYLNAVGLQLSFLSIDETHPWDPFEMEFNLSSGLVGLGALKTSWNAHHFEMRRELLTAALGASLRQPGWSLSGLSGALVEQLFSVDVNGFLSALRQPAQFRALTSSDDPVELPVNPFRLSIHDVYGGVDLSGDGRGDQYVPASGADSQPATFYPLRLFAYGDELQQKDFLLRVQDLPSGWAVYPLDANGEIVHDSEYPLTLAPPLTLLGTSWVIGSTPGAAPDVYIDFSLLEDGVLSNPVLDTVSVRFSQVPSISPAAGCTAPVVAASVTVPANGGSGAASVTGSSQCPWAPSSDASWVAVGGGGTELTYTAGANPGFVSRSAVITLQPYGATLTLTQPAAGSGPVTNLLANPSFEQGTLNWFCNGCAQLRELQLVADGHESAFIGARAGSWSGPTQNVTQLLSNGQTYTVWSQARTTRAQGSALRFTLYLNTTAGVKYIAGPPAAMSSSQFTWASGDVLVTWSGVLLEARLYAETVGDSEAFYLDNVGLALRGSAPAPPPAVENLLANPSFEQGSASWTCNGCTQLRETTVVQAGGEAALISARAGSWAGPTQVITSQLAAGKTYAVSGFVRTTNVSGTTARFTIYLHTTAGVTYLAGPQANVVSMQFTKIEGQIAPQWSGTLLEARVYVETGGDASPFYVDNLALSTLP